MFTILFDVLSIAIFFLKFFTEATMLLRTKSAVAVWSNGSKLIPFVSVLRNLASQSALTSNFF